MNAEPKMFNFAIYKSGSFSGHTTCRDHILGQVWGSRRGHRIAMGIGDMPHRVINKRAKEVLNIWPDFQWEILGRVLLVNSESYDLYYQLNLHAALGMIRSEISTLISPVVCKLTLMLLNKLEPHQQKPNAHFFWDGPQNSLARHHSLYKVREMLILDDEIADVAASLGKGQFGNNQPSAATMLFTDLRPIQAWFNESVYEGFKMEELRPKGGDRVPDEVRLKTTPLSEAHLFIKRTPHHRYVEVFGEQVYIASFEKYALLGAIANLLEEKYAHYF